MNRRAFLTTAACTLATASAGAQNTVAPAYRFSAAIDYSAARDGAALLIARNGVVLAERYADGADPGTLWPLGAATRAFAALLAASLVQDGVMRLDEPVGMTLGDWAADPAKSVISIQALLAGVSGLSFNGQEPSLAAALALTPSTPPGARFSDDAAAYLLFSEIARRKLITTGNGLDPASYLMERTLGPVGCTPVAWARTQDGVLLHDGAAASARGWAQMGELIRREGVWRAEQLVDGFTVREAMRGGFVEPRAGIGLWLAAGSTDPSPLAGSDLWRMRPPAPLDLVMAAGDAGQRLYIIPSQRLVIVRLPRNAAARGWSDAEFLPLLYRDL